jgi:hypothetical protein
MMQWNNETWYSRLIGIILFIGLLLSLSFYIGIQYQLTQRNIAKIPAKMAIGTAPIADQTRGSQQSASSTAESLAVFTLTQAATDTAPLQPPMVIESDCPPTCEVSHATSTVTGWITPTRGPVGTVVQIHVQSFSSKYSVTFSTANAYPAEGVIDATLSNNAGVITYQIPRTITRCDPSSLGCTGPLEAVTPGAYVIAVFTGNPQPTYAGAHFTVTVAAAN